MNENLIELSLEEQQNVCGGDWCDAAFALIEGLALGIGLL